MTRGDLPHPRRRGCVSVRCSESEVLLYNRLSREALAEVTVVKEWKMSPKTHLFIHLMEWQVTEVGLNPRGYWTHADEDLVGTMVEVSKSCHPSTLAPCQWLLLHCTKSEWRPHDLGELQREKKKHRLTRRALCVLHHEHPPYPPLTDKNQTRNTHANTNRNTKTLPRPTLHRR